MHLFAYNGAAETMHVIYIYIVHGLNTASTHVDKTHMKQKCLIVQIHCDNKLCIVIYMHTQTCPYIYNMDAY